MNHGNLTQKLNTIVGEGLRMIGVVYGKIETKGQETMNYIIQEDTYQGQHLQQNYA